MLAIKNKNLLIFANLGFLILIALLYLLLTGQDSEAESAPPAFDNVAPNVGVVGSHGYETSEQGVGTFVDEGVIYMLWRGTGNYSDIYFSYYPAKDNNGNWTSNGWSIGEKIAGSGHAIQTYYGVEAVLFTPDPAYPDTKRVCLFLKVEPERDVSDVRYTCTKEYQNSVDGKPPTFKWGEIQTFPKIPKLDARNNDIWYNTFGVVSTQKKPGDDSSFYMVINQIYDDKYNCTDCFDTNYLQLNHVYPDGDSISFSQIDYHIGKFYDPGLLSMPSSNSFYSFYSFFNDRNEEGSAPYTLSYLQVYPNNNSSVTSALNAGGSPRTTKVTVSPYIFKDNMYVAYILTNNKSEFSKTSMHDWNQKTPPADKTWVHCGLLININGTIYDAGIGRGWPKLFEYNDGLYLAFNDGYSKPHGNRISYMRIDNVNVNHYDENNNLNCYWPPSG